MSLKCLGLTQDPFYTACYKYAFVIQELSIREAILNRGLIIQDTPVIDAIHEPVIFIVRQLTFNKQKTIGSHHILILKMRQISRTGSNDYLLTFVDDLECDNIY